MISLYHLFENDNSKFPNYTRLVKIMKSFNFPIDQYYIISSGSLAAHGIRDCNDFDVTCKSELWNKIKNKYPANEKVGRGILLHSNPEIETFNDDYPPLKYTYKDILSRMERADIIDGIKFESLPDVLEWKRRMGREKDLKDIELIKTYIKSGG